MPRGRPKKVITDKMKREVYQGAVKFLSQQQLADLIGISLATFKRNRAIFDPIIKQAVENDPECNIPRVKSALLQRALGYNITETKTEQIMKQDPEKGWIVDEDTKRVTTTTKHVAGNPQAQMFILCNKSDYQSMHKVEPIIDENTEPFVIVLKEDK